MWSLLTQTATGLTAGGAEVQWRLIAQSPVMPLLAIPFPAIDPVALSLGPLVIRWYALAYVAGLLGGWFYAKRLAAKTELWSPLPQPKALDVDDLIVWVALGVVLG